ncbi:MAG: hypothetical protein IKY94_02620 [Lachnospiraceae bacterium]|nr:hypothetical protein [Lachnospiraceae bacterium]
MKEKGKFLQGHIVIIILLMFVFSFLCWKQFFENIDTMVFTAHENEALSKTEIFDEYIDTVDSAWYDQVFEKKNLNALHSMYVYYTLKEIPSEQVVAGKDDWLFYVEKSDGDSIADYEGTKRYPEEEMKEFLYTTLVNQIQMEEKGIQTAILVAPNKENVYPDYMADFYVHNPVSNTDLLVEYLQNNGVRILSSKENMLELASEYELYYPYDSHWNQLGAYVAVGSILQSFHIATEKLENRQILSYPLKGNYHEGAWSDLAHLGGLNYIFDDEMEYEVEGTVQIDWNQYAVTQFNKEVWHYSNADAKLSQSLFLIGDSFRTAMIPALCELYQEVYVIHRTDYMPQMLEEIQPDYVIVEYVERYANQMKEFCL